MRSWPTLVLILTVAITLGALVTGCGVRGVKRAPIETIPADAEPETRIDMLEAMTDNYPEDANLYFEIGNMYYDQLMPSDAVRNYEKALELDPKMNAARVNLAMLFAESAEADSARVLLEEALRIDPEDAKAYNNLGMIYYTEMDVDMAVKYFSKAISIAPESIEAHYNLGLAFAESGLLLEAIREWRRVLELDQESETAQRARLSLDRAEKELKR
jgi:tetratricopeptide (TPR) repeat protein